MVFWRKKKNIADQEREEQEDRIVHRPNDPAIEPPTEYDPEISEDFIDHELEESSAEILDELEVTPVPTHTKLDDALDAEELRDDSNEGGWFSKMTKGLSKSSNKIGGGISDIFTKKKLDKDMLQDLEDLLITADLGPKTASKIVEEFAKDRFDKNIDPVEVKAALAEAIETILTPVAIPFATYDVDSGPFTILVCGVNGVGKTTTIGKLAKNFKKERGKSVMLAAGDTFRAAAIEQLAIWGERTSSPVFAKEIGADAASVAYEAYEKAKADNVDILMIDTAGRLQNKKNLMEELAKIVRVLKKQDENLPHAVLLVLDSTTGQNAHSQVKTFKELVDVTGLIVTKLDGSAKGGVVVSLAEEFGLPIHAIGVGEGAEDLQPFRAEDFAKALIGLQD
jgi:fused signal recognition particle receptor